MLTSDRRTGIICFFGRDAIIRRLNEASREYHGATSGIETLMESKVWTMNRAALSLAFLFSGVSGLIYQTVWMRELRLIFGVSTAASAAVLAIFMGGLWIGSLVRGRRVAPSGTA